jgi:hypothetical protein
VDFNSFSFQIFNNELEKQQEFENLHDWALPVELTRRTRRKKKKEIYGELKCSIKIAKCDGKEHFESEKLVKVPSSIFRIKRSLMVETPVVVRVYVVQALNLRPKDIFSQSDAFIKVELGDLSISDRINQISNQTNPIFGRRFQLSSVVPRETLLKVSVYDSDKFSGDDLIGSTVVDLEDRIQSKYLATCGLPREYNSDGYNIWRNPLQPSEILCKVCNELELTLPKYFPDRVVLAGIEFKDSSSITHDSNKKERLALSVLNNFNKIPGIGFNFVPEHVETRSIYINDRPGIEQGKLLMWVEIFDSKKAIPEPIDITPVPARPYELRVIVWNTKDVVMDEKNIFGKNMSDIYVKG